MSEVVEVKKCPACNGTGKVMAHYGDFSYLETCPKCLGKGVKV